MRIDDTQAERYNTLNGNQQYAVTDLTNVVEASLNSLGYKLPYDPGTNRKAILGAVIANSEDNMLTQLGNAPRNTRGELDGAALSSQMEERAGKTLTNFLKSAIKSLNLKGAGDIENAEIREAINTYASTGMKAALAGKDREQVRVNAR